MIRAFKLTIENKEVAGLDLPVLYFESMETAEALSGVLKDITAPGKTIEIKIEPIEIMSHGEAAGGLLVALAQVGVMPK